MLNLGEHQSHLPAIRPRFGIVVRAEARNLQHQQHLLLETIPRHRRVYHRPRLRRPQLLPNPIHHPHLLRRPEELVRRELPRHQHRQYHPEAVHVAPVREQQRPVVLRCDVPHRPRHLRHHLPAHRHRLRHHLREPEVGYPRVQVLVQQYVRRLQVPVDHPRAVHRVEVLEAGGHAERDVIPRRPVQLPPPRRGPPDGVVQRPVPHELVDEVVAARPRHVGQEREEVGVAHAADGEDLRPHLPHFAAEERRFLRAEPRRVGGVRLRDPFDRDGDHGVTDEQVGFVDLAAAAAADDGQRPMVAGGFELVE
ncbi:hypothetical protein Cni_G23152 [Canna indica]|uniref:Uncharacterized protein n=1 Tax=Canna indica TaxID=4628 RepID=A0AAQ3KZD4_9LILI|nr:hypothetical protein Cni_G23152 [Canna indica]